MVKFPEQEVQWVAESIQVPQDGAQMTQSTREPSYWLATAIMFTGHEGYDWHRGDTANGIKAEPGPQAMH